MLMLPVPNRYRRLLCSSVEARGESKACVVIASKAITASLEVIARVVAVENLAMRIYHRRCPLLIVRVVARQPPPYLRESLALIGVRQSITTAIESFALNTIVR